MKKNSTTLLTLLFLLFSIHFIGQNQITNNFSAPEECGSAIIHDRLMRNDPDYKNRMLQNEAIIQNIISSGNNRSGGAYIIPVVVHVLHLGESVGTGTNISDAQINSAIANLNACYAGNSPYSLDIAVQFQLAQRRYDCAASTGIVRINASATSNYATNGITSANETTVKALSKWPNSEYYNIWIVSEIEDNNAGAGTQGYAYYPGAGANVDGAVILYNSFGYDPTGALGYNLKNYTNRNVTTLHELGHAFNLKHTFEGDDANSDGTADQCPANVTCATQGDFCCDTEAHRRNDGNCGSTGTTCSGQNISTIVNNIMAYSSDVCQTLFTADQKTRIRAAISGTRASLLTSPGLMAVSGSTPSIAKSCSPQTTNLANGFAMGVYGLKIGSTEYSSSGTVADGGFRNNWCSNFNLTVNTSYAITVTNGTINNEKVKVYIDYNNDGDFVDAGEEVYSDNTGAASHTGAFTTAASPVTGQALWLRVVSDFSGNTISGPCYIPQYGQVEDFSVLFPASGSTQLISAQCGSSVGTLTGTFDCDAVTNAQDYEWEFTNVGLGYTFTRTRGNNMSSIPRTWISGLQFGQTYNVRIRAKIAGVWGSFGNNCAITITGSVPTTQLSSSQCGQSIADLSGLFYNNAVDGAQDYEWEFTNAGLGFTFSKVRGNDVPSIPKTWITGLQYGQTYNVRVRTKIGGTWGSYGTVCSISISGSTPTTQIIPAECGQSFADLSGVFNCTAVTGAEDYEWEFTNVGLGYTFNRVRGNNMSSVPKTWIIGLQYGQTYSVRVRVKVGSVWGSYGSTCTIAISGSIPLVQLDASQCGLATNLNGTFIHNAIVGAQNYEWEFTNAGLGYTFSRTRGNNMSSIPKLWIIGLQNGVTYNVRIRANIGGAWGSYGSVCQVTINTALGFIANNSNTRGFILEDEASLSSLVNVYPNPSTNNGFNLKYEIFENENAQTEIEIVDVLGRRVLQKQITSTIGINEIKLNSDGNLPKGTYVLVIRLNTVTIKKNIIVQ